MSSADDLRTSAFRTEAAYDSQTEGRDEATSLGELVAEVTRDLSTLMRQELELAKAEMKEEAAKVGKASGMLGGAGLAGWMVLLFASLALAWALGNVMDLGWAGLIVAVIWAVVGAVLYSVGRRKLREVDLKPRRTVQTLKEDAQWAKNPTS